MGEDRVRQEPPARPRPSGSPDAGNFGLTADGVALYVPDSARRTAFGEDGTSEFPIYIGHFASCSEAVVSAENGEPHMLSMALLYAGAGICVFPVNDTKAPLTPKGTPERPGGFHYATTEREQVEEWWTQWPNAGIATPDFDAVDVDLYKPACTPTWKRIKPLIPEGTPQNRTARGGLQFIFAGRERSRTTARSGPASTSATRGRNYIILPPSFALGGRYEAVVNVLARRPKPAPEFGRAADAGSDFTQLA